MSEEDRKVMALIERAAELLAVSGNAATCRDVTNWTGTPEQQVALANLHKALDDLLPPLP